MNKEIEINDILFDKELHLIINEELGINNEVVEESNKFINLITNSIKNTPTSYKQGGVFKKEGQEKILLFNKVNVTILWTYYNFKDYEIYNTYNSMINALNGISNLNNFRITIFAISGNIISNTLNDTVFHELEHLFQQIKSNALLSDDDFYKLVARNLNNKNEAINIASKILYISFKKEQEAFANGFYGFLTKNKPNPYEMDDILKYTDIYSHVVHLRKHYNTLINTNDELFEELVQNVYPTLTKNKLLKICKYSIKSLLHKIGRTIAKYNKDFNIQENFYYSHIKPYTPIYELHHLEFIKRKDDRQIDFS